MGWIRWVQMTFLSHHIIIIAVLRSPVPAIQTATDVAHQHVSVTMCTMLFLPGMGAVEQALLLCWKRCVYSQQVDKGCSPNALLGHWTCAAQHPGAVIFAVWCFGGLLVFEWGRACFFSGSMPKAGPLKLKCGCCFSNLTQTFFFTKPVDASGC